MPKSQNQFQQNKPDSRDDAWIYEDKRYDYDEIRYVAYGMLEKRLHFICFTETDAGIRV